MRYFSNTFELYDTQIDAIGKLNQITLQKISEEQPTTVENQDERSDDINKIKF